MKKKLINPAVETPDRELSREVLRRHFIRIIHERKPEVLETLRSTPYEIFCQTEFANCIDLIWHDLRTGPRIEEMLNLRINPETENLHRQWAFWIESPGIRNVLVSLYAWSSKYHLAVNWVIADALLTLEQWSKYENDRENMTWYLVPIARNELDPISQPGLPVFNPLRDDLESYIDGIKSEAERIIRDSTILCAAHPSDVRAFVRGIEKRAREYCLKSIEVFNAHGFITVGKSDWELHLLWTVRRVLGETWEQLVREEVGTHLKKSGSRSKAVREKEALERIRTSVRRVLDSLEFPRQLLFDKPGRRSKKTLL